MKKASAIFLVLAMLAAFTLPAALATDPEPIEPISADLTDGASAGDGDPADGAGDAPAAAAPLEPDALDPPDSVPTGGTGETMRVYITGVINGSVKLAGQPLDVGDMDTDGRVTTNDALILAHQVYYPGVVRTELPDADSGTIVGPDDSIVFSWGIDATYNIYLINTIWGQVSTPNQFLNGQTFGGTLDPEPLKDGSNLMFQVSSRVAANGAAFPTVRMTYDEETKAVTAETAAFDFATFGYTYTPFGNIPLIEADTGKPIGNLNNAGRLVLTDATIPDCGVVMVAGNSALRIVRGGADDDTQFRAFAGTYEPPPPDYSLFGGASGQATLRIVIVSFALAIPLGIIVYRAQVRELKNRGRTFAKPSKIGKR